MNLYFQHGAYDVLIRQDVFDIIKEYDEQTRYDAETMAFEEAKGYLLGRYANQLDCLLFNVSNFSSATTYNTYDHVWHNGLMYFCMLDSTTSTPPAIYNNTATYNIGDIICHNTACFECTTTNGAGAFNSNDWQQIAAEWLQKDRRNPSLLMFMMDMVLYHIHTRINPRQIPEQRYDRYQRAIEWLKSVQKGVVSIDPDCPSNYLYPTPVNNSTNASDLIEYGSRCKRNNHY